MNPLGRFDRERHFDVSHLASAFGALATLALASVVAAQNAVSYDYVTGDQPYGSPLAGLFTGYAVSGTFDYDSSVPASGTVGTPPMAGSTVYANAMTNLSGSVAGSAFFDPYGRAVVGDDTYTTPTEGPVDILVLAGDPGRQGGLPPSAYDFMGFDIAGYTLQNARLFWIEGLFGAGDFLSNQTLPALLPGFFGRLALDFVPSGTTGPLESVFFDLLVVDAEGETVAIDIKPNDATNRVNPKAQGDLAVAILTTDEFDALDVDPLSVTFGPMGASEAHARGHWEDVDGDGDLDLVLHFRIPATGIRPGDTEATLVGMTYAGQRIAASDAIDTVGGN